MSRHRLKAASMALAVAATALVAVPTTASAAVPDQIRYAGASIHNATAPAKPVEVEMWSSSPARKTELLVGSRVVASDTTVVARDGYWAGEATADLTGLKGWTTVTLRITSVDGVVRSTDKKFVAQGVATQPDQIRWNGASLQNATVPARSVEVELWSSTAAARTELLVGGRVVATDSTVEAREGYWAGVATADLTGLNGWVTATLRITTPTGQVRTETKGFIAQPVALTTQPDQIRWNGASIHKTTVPGGPLPLEVWSSTPASKVELLLGGRVVATDTTVEAGPDHWRAAVTVDLTGLPKGSHSLTMRVTPTSGFVRSATKTFSVDPVVAPPTSQMLAARPGDGNTGVPAGTTLRRSGSLTITQDGAVVQGLDIDGCVVVAADDVTIRKSRIRCTDSPKKRAVVMDGEHSGLLIEDVEIDGGGTTDIGVDVSRVVLRRLDIHHVNDGVRMGSDIVLEDSWIHDLSRIGGLHPDAVQGISAQDVVIRNNTLDPRDPETGDNGNAAIMLGSETGTRLSRGVLIEGNFLDGGNVSLNVSGSINAQDVVIRHNRFGTASQYGPVLTPRRVAPGPGNVMDTYGTAIVVRWTD
ncbi:right-handed parallel beta-helix repeat-containing protein [Actinotalea ferrariae]|uniref:right-handed parallel beta-helix repeat-containing protein n=1 Tax=Actinotalea ferrariae TaxID=1386098 RepID=UPI001C8B8C40|nr:right-handed parallel beta-helix repeat-containing protein [Actinotalea ferrariae]MBX9244515.1 right-handed parallel beta-helix repeat-containing protein [Actinotalea ferrariae]